MRSTRCRSACRGRNGERNVVYSASFIAGSLYHLNDSNGTEADATLATGSERTSEPRALIT